MKVYCNVNCYHGVFKKGEFYDVIDEYQNEPPFPKVKEYLIDNNQGEQRWGLIGACPYNFAKVTPLMFIATFEQKENRGYEDIVIGIDNLEDLMDEINKYERLSDSKFLYHKRFAD